MTTMLEPVADDIWLADGPDVDFHNFPYPTRMVVVRLAQRALWVWSPIQLRPDLAAAVADVGTVAHLVSPNKLHYLFLGEWRERFPQARLWAPATMIAKRPDLGFETPLTGEPPAAWHTEIDQAWFRGSPMLDEIVFFHRASRTVIFADLVQAFDDEYLKAHYKTWQRALARFGGITLSAGAHAPIDLRLSFFNRRPARDARRTVLDWKAERVVMAHGVWQRQNGSAFVARSLAWLG